MAANKLTPLQESEARRKAAEEAKAAEAALKEVENFTAFGSSGTAGLETLFGFVEYKKDTALVLYCCPISGLKKENK